MAIQVSSESPSSPPCSERRRNTHGLRWYTSVGMVEMEFTMTENTMTIAPNIHAWAYTLLRRWRTTRDQRGLSCGTGTASGHSAQETNSEHTNADRPRTPRMLRKMAEHKTTHFRHIHLQMCAVKMCTQGDDKVWFGTRGATHQGSVAILTQK